MTARRKHPADERADLRSALYMAATKVLAE
jgi:hypothetical protein